MKTAHASVRPEYRRFTLKPGKVSNFVAFAAWSEIPTSVRLSSQKRIHSSTVSGPEPFPNGAFGNLAMRLKIATIAEYRIDRYFSRFQGEAAVFWPNGSMCSFHQG